ncbi:MAG: hypothetical protein C0475_08155 [Planctomyces sp.]|nr:hypothetical protein [Planctomyces sp.]MBA4039743.1 hypothetical protein [Planctomyces sp.]
MAGCSASDATSARLTLFEDLSGTILTSQLSVAPEPDTPEASGVAGVRWRSQGRITLRSGRFDRVTDVRLADIAFVSASTEGIKGVTVRIPLGPSAQWPGWISADAARIDDARAALDPDNLTEKLGKVAVLTITAPGAVTSSVVGPARARGLSASFEDKTATVEVPIEWAQRQDEPIVWQVTWR